MYKTPITNGEHYHQSSAMLLLRFPCQLFLGCIICGMIIYGYQQMFHNQGLGYTSTLSSLKSCIKWKGHSQTRYVLLFEEYGRGYMTPRKWLAPIMYMFTVIIRLGMMEISVVSGKLTTWKLLKISITWTEKLEIMIVSSYLMNSCMNKWLNIKRMHKRRLLMDTLGTNILTTHIDLPHLPLDL